MVGGITIIGTKNGISKPCLILAVAAYIYSNILKKGMNLLLPVLSHSQIFGQNTSSLAFYDDW